MDERQKRMRRARAAERRAWDAWQRSPLPVGTQVEVTRDNGEVLLTKTRSEPWKLAEGTPVILVEGIAGGYLLTRVRPVA